MKKVCCEICGEAEVEKHHIVSKSLGGSNKPYNLCYLCPNHHAMVHREGKLIIEGKFLTDCGYQLIWHMKGEESITGMEVGNVYINKKKTGEHINEKF